MMKLKNSFSLFAQRTPCLKHCFPAIRPDNRTIFIGQHPVGDSHDAIVHERFCSNRVTTAKYTIWNFIFKNMYEQLRRIANFYFLVNAIIQLTNPNTPVSPATSVVPLIFVLTVTAIKQAYEDWLRHKEDRKVNDRICRVVKRSALVDVKAKDVQVGDILRIDDDQEFPCDMLLLSSADPEGQCTIQTANLDGETNLKVCFSVDETKMFDTPEKLAALRGFIECQQPITDLYRFVGKVTVVTVGGHVTKALFQQNVLLRGAKLKNTDFIYGCAVYTGQETKMALNSKLKTNKRSRVEKGLNSFLIAFLVLLISETLIATGLHYWFLGTWVKQESRPQWYLPLTFDYEKSNTVVTARYVVLDFLSCSSILNYVIPISLYVTIEMQKFFGSMFFGYDNQMYDDKIDEPAKANTSDLNEELGQVEYLFCDKTGTLTENEMQFRQCSIDGVLFIEENGKFIRKSTQINADNLTDETDGKDVGLFFEVLGLCHTVRVDRKRVGTVENLDQIDGFQYEYHASSPDEKALVEACRRFGVIYHGYRDGKIELTHYSKLRAYTLHHVLEFDSDRKCMTVIVENDKGEFHVLCKGAESSVIKKCVAGNVNATIEHVDYFASLGLRTLVIASKVISRRQFQDYSVILEEAKQNLENRDEEIHNAYSVIEQGFTVIGATAVEDKLQDGVKYTIENLRTAGIKVWVLTGDKEETAVNISNSAGHFDMSMHMLGFTLQQTEAESYEVLLTLRENIEARMVDKKIALVVDGISLALILKRYSLEFRDVCMMCHAVLCCRMTPIQKAEIVKLIKNSPSNPTTAAIGDGANDVSMIQEAHIGIGIMGKEGRQASRCSDYSFGRFRFLNRALLVHGHYFYVRIANLIQYFFYKNIAFVTAQFYFIFFSAYSFGSVFDNIFLLFYNLTFTSLPVLLYGLYEQHLPQQTLLENPALYKTIKRNELMSAKNFVLWNLNGFYHSVIFFFGVHSLYSVNEELLSEGMVAGLFTFGAVIISICMIAVNIKLMLYTYYWCFPIFVSYVVTFGGNWGMLWIYSSFIWSWNWTQDFLGVLLNMFSSAECWLTFLLIIVAALLPDIVQRAWHDMMSPLHRTIVQSKQAAFTSVHYISSDDRISIKPATLLPKKSQSQPVAIMSHRMIGQDNPAMIVDE